MQAFTAPGSFAQQRLWFLDRMDPRNPAYHVPVALRLRGTIRREAIASALNGILDRHEPLRTTFASSDGVLLQVIDPSLRIAVREEAVADQQALAGAIREEIHGAFDLVRGPLLRAALFTQSPTDAVLVVTLHHIVADAWSLGVLVHEFSVLYTASVQGEPSPLTPLSIQYADFVEWQQQAQPQVDEQLAYWKTRLAPPLAAISLPADRPRPAVFTYRGATRTQVIGRETIDRLKALAVAHNATLFMLLVGALKILLHRYTQQTDVAIGSPIANRRMQELEPLVGFFVNTQVLRTDLSGHPTFLELLARVRETCVGAAEHQDVPFERIVELLAPERDRSRSPLFQVMFALQNAPLAELTLPDLQVERVDVSTDSSKFDLTVQAEERAGGLQLRIEYNTDLYDAATIDAFAQRYEHVLRHACEEPQTPIDQIPLCTPAETAALLAWSGDGADYASDATLATWFVQTAAAQPDARALTFEGTHWTYAALAQQATQLAHALRRRGVGPETLVGLALDRSPALVVAILAVVQAGGAYVPLDPAYPAARLAFMIEDSGLRLVLTDGRTPLPAVPGVAVLDLTHDADALAAEPVTPLVAAVAATHPAYVIYTSGSTGQPKGVVVTHGNVVRLLRATAPLFAFDADDVWTLFHSSAFDFSVWELWGALLYGGRLVLVPYEVSRTPARFYALLADERVTVLNQTPSAFRQLLPVDAVESRPLALRYVIFGGEALDFALLAPWVARHGDATPALVNMYGITETTVHVTYRRLQRADLATPRGSLIGRPLGDLRLYVLDAHQALVPVGVPGELYVGGAGLARGYLGQPDLTAARFIANPFGPGRLYRTGDRARWLPTGEVEYLGRLDAQVKLRGFRIELGEIETVLRARAGLPDAVVVARPHSAGDPHLIAYARATAAMPTPADLRAQCRQWLPAYMVPAAFVFLDAWPLTANGKLDRDALPPPDLDEATGHGAYIVPRTEAEIAIADAWSSVLGIERVGVEDNFFDRGGDSILCLQVVARAARAGWKITPRQLFEQSTVERLASVATRVIPATPQSENDRAGARFPLSGLDEEQLARIIGDGAGVEDLYPLAPMQEGLLFHALAAPERQLYLEQLHGAMHGPVDPDAFEAAWRLVIARQPVLRTAFIWDGGTLLQRVEREVPFTLARLDWSALPADAQAARLATWLDDDRQRGLDLARAPLLRVTLIRLGPTAWRWIWTHHHLLLDGWSLPLLLEEVLLAYRASVAGQPLTLPPVRRYRDYIAWLQQQDPQSAEAYWRATLAGFTEPTTWRVGPRPPADAAGHGEAQLALTATETQALHAWTRRHQLTLNTLVTGAWARLLATYSGQTDIVFGVTVAGRPAALAGADRMLGLFINTLPFRVPPAIGLDLVAWLRQIQDRQVGLREAEHSRLVDIHACSALPPGQPLFDTLLAFENYPVDRAIAEGFEDLGMGPITFIERMNYPIGLAAIPGDQLTLKILFDGAWFAPETVNALLGHLGQLLRSAALDHVTRADQWRLLTIDEVAQQAQWNETATRIEETFFHRQFEAQTTRTPDAPAIDVDGAVWTYDAVNRESNQLAHHLQRCGVGPEIVVGVCLDRSRELVIALLGILKAGGAYLPIDPSLPVNRMSAVLRAARPRVVVTTQTLSIALQDFEGRVLRLDRDGPAIASEETANPDVELQPEMLAYLIFTSGSTGEPKGVMVAHRGFANLAQAQSRAFGVRDDSRVFQFAALTFDASLSEIAMALAPGGTLVLSRAPHLVPDDSFATLLRDQRITHITLPPSILARMPESALPDLTCLIVAGEACPHDVMARYSGGRSFFNAYGPTESTVCATLGICRDDAAIGRPMDNMRVHILDPHGCAVPAGVAGELHIGGIGVARGYVGRPDQTAERFVPDPFSGEAGARLYKSGDLARFLADGRIEFLGRIDHQVKVRGFRIEPGEIEDVLRRRAGFTEAVVVVREQAAGERQLVAYGVPADSDVTPASARAHCTQWLPSYSVPSAFVLLDALPLTSSGKIDRAALPDPDRSEATVREAYVAPRTAAEQALASVWAAVLGLTQVGIHDNFFALGGDSILTLQVVGHATRAGWTITPRQLFEHSTVEQLALVAVPRVDRASGDAADTQSHGVIPLTPIQAWFFDHDWVNPHRWNQAVLLETDPSVGADVLSDALVSLARHHDALRLRFKRDEHGWQQEFTPEAGVIAFDVMPLDPAHRPWSDDQLEHAFDEAHAGLHLAHGPLARAVFFDAGRDARGLLLVVIHHLIVDGVSWRVLLEDLHALCEQRMSTTDGENTSHALATTSSYGEWARSLARTAPMMPASEFEYWLARAAMSGAEFRGLPVESGSKASLAVERQTRTVARALDVEATTNLLERVPSAYRTQINDLLLAALYKAISRWTACDSMYLDLEGHGREDVVDGIDVTRTVGWFTSLFPIRLEAHPSLDASALIRSIKEQLRSVPRKGITFGIGRYLRHDDVSASLAALPVPEISFNYLGQLDQGTGSRLFALADRRPGRGRDDDERRTHLLDVVAYVERKRLRIEWMFTARCHRDATIDRVADDFIGALRELIDHCLSPDAGGATASDFPLSGLDEEQLARIIGDGAGVEDLYPLAPMQEGLLFHALAAPERQLYLEQLHGAMDGPVDPDAFEAAWRLVIARQPVLRTAFIWDGGTLLQRVEREVPFTLARLDWSALPADAQAARLATWLDDDRQRGLDLARAPLLRVTLIRLGPTAWRWIWTHHHLLLDGWSLPLLLEEVLLAYRASVAGQPLTLPPVRRYRDYIAWLQQQDPQSAEAYWRATLAGFTEPTTWRVGPRPPADAAGHGEAQLVLTATETQALHAWTRRHQLTLNTLVTGAWARLLATYSGQTDIVFGVTVAGRPAALAGADRMLGLFINTLPFRVPPAIGLDLVAWLQQIQDRQVALREAEHSRLVDIHACSALPPGQPLFDTLLAFENYPVDRALDAQLADFHVSGIHLDERTNYPLTLSVVPGNELLLKMLFDGRLFDAAAANTALGVMRHLLVSVADGNVRDVGAWSLLSPDQRRVLEPDVTVGDAGVDECLPAWFARVAAQRGDAEAVCCGNERVGYTELDVRSNRLAHHLRAMGVGPETKVAICLDRSVDLIVSILAVLKAGGAYVPLDPAYPAERLRFLVEDSQARILVTRPSVADDLRASHPMERVCLGRDAAIIAAQPDWAPDAGTVSDNAAYAIYTSGSTGTPKGCVVTHRNVVRLMKATEPWFAFDETDVWTLFHSCAFDFSVWEIWGALLYGGRLVIVPYLTSRSPEEFYELLARERVTVLNQTPSAFRQLMAVDAARQSPAAVAALRVVIFGGEALQLESLEDWFTRHGDRAPQLVNMYGITETTVHVTYRPISLDDVRSGRGSVIGVPIPDLSLHVLDAYRHPVPIGVAGELFVGGAGVARGYLSRPSLTAERFVPSSSAAGRLYRTGDLVRRLPDGDVEYLGRIDDQVKVRGFRIELGEIESAFVQHPGIREAVVLVTAGDAQPSLAAYVVPHPDATAHVSIATLRAFLDSRLPDYMVPAAFVLLEALPLTPHGKVDRTALQAMTATSLELGETYIAPRNDTEAALAVIWQEVLGVERVGVNDNFFALGGDSIRSIQVKSRARALGLPCDLQTLFAEPTIAALAAAGGATDAAPARLAPFELVSAADRARMPADIEDAYPPAELQTGMVFHTEFESGSSIYQDIFSYHLRAPWDEQVLRAAVEWLVERHAVLRASFAVGTYSEPLLLIHGRATPRLTIEDLRDVANDEQQAIVRRWIDEEARVPLAVDAPPLLAFHVFRRADDRVQLSLKFHHAILDGWSVASMLTELFQQYLERLGLGDGPGGAPPLEYRDFVAMERAAIESAEDQGFWIRTLDEAAVVQLPRLPGAVAGPRRVSRRMLEISSETSSALKQLAGKNGMPIRSFLLAAHVRVLSAVANTSDVITGLVSNGRPEVAGGDRVLGLFLNTLPFRMRVDGGSWRDLVTDTFRTEQSMLPHRRFPLRRMHQLTGRASLFETDFNFVHFHVFERLAASGLIEPLGVESLEETSFVLAADFAWDVHSDTLRGSLSFDTSQLSAEQVDRYAGYYVTALDRMAASFDDRYDTRSIVEPDEDARLRAMAHGIALDTSADHVLLHELVSAQARATPDLVAVTGTGTPLTYARLNRQANQLAHHLIRRGLSPDRPVGICLESGSMRVVALLATLKAGGAYLPLDPEYPDERLAFMIEDSGAPLVIAEPGVAHKLPSRVPLLSLAAAWPEIERQPEDAPVLPLGPDHLAYVLYTSGSTGRPKGVQIPHRAIVNHMRWMAAAFPLNVDDRVLQKTPFSFDASVWEFWAPLMAGARVIAAQPGGHRDPAYICRAVQDNQVTVLQVVPTLLAALLREPAFAACRSLARVFVGGEALTSELATEFGRVLPTAALINLYGPTEAAVDTSFHVCAPGRLRAGGVPIGRPIANASMWVVDRWKNLAPLGTIGELVVGGAGLARGYLARPALTADAFVPDPFHAGARIYRTGDLARCLPNGEFEFHGRVDGQVKFRGFRIELLEIEAALEAHPDVRQAIVSIDVDADGRSRLVAHAIAAAGSGSAGAQLTASDLRRFLRARLPDYMVPGVFVFVDAFPLTPSGKVDRRALPPPKDTDEDADRHHAPPRTALEERMAAVWARVLGVDRVGIHDNFFDLGGDSILSLQIVSEMREAGWVVTPRSIFEHGVIAEIAPHAVPTVASTEAVTARGEIPLTPIHHAFFEQDLPDPDHWNQATLLSVPPDFSLDHFQPALNAVVRHHDVFRLRATRDGISWTERYADDPGEIDCVAIDLSRASDTQRSRQLGSLADMLHASLNVSDGPVIRAAYCSIGDGHHGRVLIVIHHLVVDGVSWRILLQDLAATYRQIAGGSPVRLPAPTATYQTWAQRLQAYAASDVIAGEMEYWLAPERLAASSLPVDRAGGPAENLEADVRSIRIALDEAKTHRLLSTVSRDGFRLEETLLAAVASAVADWSGDPIVAIDLEGHGREDLFDGLDVSRTVGWFTSVFPVHLRLPASSAPLDVVAATAAELRAIPRRGIGYGLLRYLSPDREVRSRLAAAPQPEISFNYLGRLDAGRLESGPFAAAIEPVGHERSPRARRRYAIDVIARVLDGTLHVEWLYSGKRHVQETVDRLARATGSFLEAIAGRSDRTDAAEVVDVLPLTSLQEGLLFHVLDDRHPGVYVQQLVADLSGVLDTRAFQAAWDAAIARHSIFRTAFERRDLSSPVQVVWSAATCPVEWLDWRADSAERRREQWRDLLERDRARGLVLDAAPLMRVIVVRETDDAWRMLWTHHHLILDGWSLPIVLREVMAAYAHARDGSALNLGEAKPFADYARWLERQDHAAAEAYWRRTLRQFTEPVQVNVDPPSGGHTDGFGEQTIALPVDVTDGLTRLARAHRVTLNTITQAIWAILLSRYSGRQDLVFGVTVSGRPADLPGAQRMVGPFINTLPLRLDADAGQPLAAFLQAIQRGQSELSEYEFSRLVDVIGWSDVPRTQPLFETILVFENYPLGDAIAASPAAGFRVHAIESLERAHYPMTCFVMPGVSTPNGQGRGLAVRLVYQRARYDDDGARRFLSHFAVLANHFAGAAADPSLAQRPLGALSLLSPDERSRVLHTWNATAELFDATPVHVRVAQQAARTPDATAATCAGDRISYAELDRKSTQLARYLVAGGAGPERLVALSLERSIDMVVALLGILKSGAAYVPLDPAFPVERLRWMLDDSGAAMLLTSGTLGDQYTGYSGQIVRLDSEWPVIANAAATGELPSVAAENLAYVIYTSGSTGTPKGVAVRHGALANFLCDFDRRARLGAADVVVSVTTLSFDIAGLELYLPLISGASVVIARADEAADGDRLAALLDETHATVLQATPATWRLLLNAGWTPGARLRIWCGGEALPRDLAAALATGVHPLWNLYGPTETTIWATVHCVRAGDEASCIGRPIANTTTYVVDEYLNPVPPGMEGELLIGGDGLARGYWAQPDATAARFIPDPFGSAPGARLYRTGDRVRYAHDGRLEFVGRLDSQLKLRGFRIEAGEIESVLRTHAAVADSVVSLREVGGTDHLVAYVVPGGGVPLSAAVQLDLRERLKRTLPDYMLPSFFVSLTEMPLTPNRKVDRKRLPAPDMPAGEGGEAYVPPRTAVERVLAELWQQLLRIDRVGIHDDFFRLGGHSLLAAQMLSWLRRVFRQELSLRTLFEATTLEQLALALLAAESEPGLCERAAATLLRIQAMSPDERAAVTQQLRDGTAHSQAGS